MMKKLRILLADDHRMVREGLRILIDSHSAFKVVGLAASGREAVALARDLKPDVVVMDLSMPDMNGLQATERLKADQPRIRVVALTAYEDENFLRQLCRLGAAGFVLKRSAGDDLLRAIDAVGRGEVYFEGDLAAKALALELDVASHQPHKMDLSQREQQVLVLLAWGYTNKEVAAKLKLSVKTVETYKVRIAEKLGLRSRTDIVRYALRRGWLSEPTPAELAK